MKRDADSDLDVQAHCRSLALQQIGMLTRIAEIGMRLVEAEGAKAIAQAERPDAGQPESPRADAPATVDHGLAFSRHAQTVQRALALRSRAATDLCARDKAHRKARRARQRNHVNDALHALIWNPAQSTRELDEADYHTNNLHERLDALYDDEDDRIEDRPVGAVIAALACGLGLSDEWRHRAADWSDPPYPPPPAGNPDEVRKRRRVRLVELMQQTLDAISDREKAAGLKAGLEARLEEPDIEALIDAEPPAAAAERLCRSLGIDFHGDCLEPKQPDTG